MRVIYFRPDLADQAAIVDTARAHKVEVIQDGPSIQLVNPSEKLLEDVASLKISGVPFDKRSTRDSRIHLTKGHSYQAPARC